MQKQQKQQSALTVILNSVIGDLTSIILIKYSYSSVPGWVYSHFLEASSWNCGSLCHNYNLVIINLH